MVLSVLQNQDKFCAALNCLLVIITLQAGNTLILLMESRTGSPQVKVDFSVNNLCLVPVCERESLSVEAILACVCKNGVFNLKSYV